MFYDEACILIGHDDQHDEIARNNMIRRMIGSISIILAGAVLKIENCFDFIE